MNECRSCAAPLGAPFLSLGASPVSNAYLRAEQLSAMEPTWPLDLHVCEQCWLVQLDEFQRADHIFSEDYAYFSSFSASWLAHCRTYTENVTARFGLDRESFVVEVASNDGYLLQYFRDKGIPLLGIEPAASVANAAIAKGIPTEIVFFGVAQAEAMRARGQLADLLAGNNVLAHNPNINDFVGGIARVLKPTGIATLEFPHLVRMLEANQFDTIYHEHFSYLSLIAVEALFERHGLVIFDVDELPTHGGSLRIYAQLKATGTHAVEARVPALRTAEEAAGLRSLATYTKFREQVVETKRKLLTLLVELKRAGKRIVGYGAPAKGNTLLNYCGIRGDFLDYTVDSSPHKQGRFLPGTRLPIHAPAKILEDKPDFVLILPWNIRDEIIAQMRGISEWGGKFIVPIPVPEIVA
ncbi:MAG: methyltransferase domain-containing protein [Deltaproteobacteria bacterium]|nr:methyltransferase domain-containing protein [Deltaproteobacteria bacterium]